MITVHNFTAPHTFQILFTSDTEFYDAVIKQPQKICSYNQQPLSTINFTTVNTNFS